MKTHCRLLLIAGIVLAATACELPPASATATVSPGTATPTASPTAFTPTATPTATLPSHPTPTRLPGTLPADSTPLPVTPRPTHAWQWLLDDVVVVPTPGEAAELCVRLVGQQDTGEGFWDFRREPGVPSYLGYLMPGVDSACAPAFGAGDYLIEVVTNIDGSSRGSGFVTLNVVDGNRYTLVFKEA